MLCVLYIYHYCLEKSIVFCLCLPGNFWANMHRSDCVLGVFIVYLSLSMKHIKTALLIAASLFIVTGALITPAYAAPNDSQGECQAAGGTWHPTIAPGQPGNDSRSTSKAAWCEGAGDASEKPADDANGCGGVTTAIIKCDQDGTGTDVTNTGVWGILLLVINILTAGVGVAALGGLIYGAVLYTASGGSPDQIKKARTIFTNVVVGIIAYAAMFALLNFIIPGGVFQ